MINYTLLELKCSQLNFNFILDILIFCCVKFKLHGEKTTREMMRNKKKNKFQTNNCTKFDL